ncbi:MAG: DNA mismatch repair protein MutS, partial [Desulfovibrionaceae bacterium]
VLWQGLAKLAPRELLLPGDAAPPPGWRDLAVPITRLPAAGPFDVRRAARAVAENQGVEDLATLGLADQPELLRCLGALLAYLRETQRHDLGHLGEFRLLDLSRHLILDEVTERNLELFRRLDGRTGSGTLWAVLDRTMTPMGARLLAERLKRPWREAGPILASQACVARLVEGDALRGELRAALKTVYDLERLSTRVCLGRCTPKDLAALAQTLRALPRLHAALAAEAGLPKSLADVLAHWDPLEDLSNLLDRALVDSPPPTVMEGGLFRPGFDPRLDELIELTEHGEAAVQHLLATERERSGIAKLKLGFNKVFGYYFEVSRVYTGPVPEYFERRQTLVNGERYITPELKTLEERLLSASDERKNLEYQLFQGLRATLAEARTRLVFMAQALAGLDYWQGLAEVARVGGWVRPEIHSGLEIELDSARHPVVEAAQGGNFTPNSLSMDQARRLLLITGPNMAGKSTVLRQVAIAVILAQMGAFVPAAGARIGLADRVFSRVGASDNLAQGQSTFMVEMMETARILRLATSRSLVILDEIGRGTSTFDGLALAWAVVEELSRRGRGTVRTLFATHYHELTRLEGVVDGLRNLNIAVKEYKGDVVFLRRLIPGPADKSYGIEVARLAGVPMPVVERAREILANLEETSQHRRRMEQAVQTLLPGLTPAPAAAPAPADEEHPLLRRLRELDIDALTPLAALNLLGRWRQELADEDRPGTPRADDRPDTIEPEDPA